MIYAIEPDPANYQPLTEEQLWGESLQPAQNAQQFAPAAFSGPGYGDVPRPPAKPATGTGGES